MKGKNNKNNRNSQYLLNSMPDTVLSMFVFNYNNK